MSLKRSLDPVRTEVARHYIRRTMELDPIGWQSLLESRAEKSTSTVPYALDVDAHALGDLLLSSDWVELEIYERISGSQRRVFRTHIDGKQATIPVKELDAFTKITGVEIDGEIFAVAACDPRRSRFLTLGLERTEEDYLVRTIWIGEPSAPPTPCQQLKRWQVVSVNEALELGITLVQPACFDPKRSVAV